MTATKLKRREFLQLAKTYDPTKPPRNGYALGGWYVSEKLDGQRCFWDGGITRGLKTTDVPWASVINPKTGAIKTKIRPLATGLWSRYGNPIMAPDWFLNGLPCVPLDGELFAGRGQFQTTMSAVRKDNPIDSEWEDIQFAVYSSPSFESIFGSGEIKNANFHCEIQWGTMQQWLAARIEALPTRGDFIRAGSTATFRNELNLIDRAMGAVTDFAYLHKQILLPEDNDRAVEEVERQLDKVLDRGGEGLIIRSADAIWYPKRMAHILKYKPYSDAEATITGFTSGREGKQGLLLGKIGALITDFRGKRLEVSGLTHEEREFSTDFETSGATNHPGVDMPMSFQGKHFKVGDVITIRYRELSDDLIPKDARFCRCPDNQ